MEWGVTCASELEATPVDKNVTRIGFVFQKLTSTPTAIFCSRNWNRIADLDEPQERLSWDMWKTPQQVFLSFTRISASLRLWVCRGWGPDGDRPALSKRDFIWKWNPGCDTNNSTNLESMDPLSVSTGIITFIGAAITILNTSKALINDIKDAFEEVSQLARETDELRKVFEKIKTLEALVAQHPEDLVRQAGLSVTFVQGCTQDLQNLKIMVEVLHHRLKGTRTSRARARIGWALGTKSRLMECTQKIQGHKTSLILAFEILNGHVQSRSPIWLLTMI